MSINTTTMTDIEQLEQEARAAQQRATEASAALAAERDLRDAARAEQEVAYRRQRLAEYSAAAYSRAVTLAARRVAEDISNGTWPVHAWAARESAKMIAHLAAEQANSDAQATGARAPHLDIPTPTYEPFLSAVQRETDLFERGIVEAWVARSTEQMQAAVLGDMAPRNAEEQRQLEADQEEARRVERARIGPPSVPFDEITPEHRAALGDPSSRNRGTTEPVAGRLATAKARAWPARCRP